MDFLNCIDGIAGTRFSVIDKQEQAVCGECPGIVRLALGIIGMGHSFAGERQMLYRLFMPHWAQCRRGQQLWRRPLMKLWRMKSIRTSI